MNNNNGLSILTQLYEKMASSEKEEFIKYLSKNSLKNKIENSPNNKTENKTNALVKNSEINLNIDKCPHCSSTKLVKNGKSHGNQRFMCKECNKTFTCTHNSILFSSKKDINTWIKYCECFMNKFSIRKSAEICNINTHTAFNWRHKILDALHKMQNDVHLDGIVEMDETFFALSFKGKHKNFRLPRVSHKRGHSVSTRGLSKELVCVPSIVNLNGLSIAKISNLGKPTFKDLNKIMNNQVELGSIFVTDSMKSYQKIAFDNELTHVRIARGRYTNGSFNIQTVNSYHSELKRMIIGNFKGVATKYLNNYIVYNNFVNFAKGSFINKFSILKDFVFNTKLTVRGYDIVNRDAIPV